MASVNKVILLGNLGKDPEVRHLEGGVAVARFPIATSESFKDKAGNKQERTEWHNIVVWRGLAEVAEKYLKKGQSVYIEGKIRTTSYEKDGQTRYNTEIVADNMTMLGGRSDNGGGSSDSSSANNNYGSNQAAATSGKGSAFNNDEPDDLPF